MIAHHTFMEKFEFTFWVISKKSIYIRITKINMHGRTFHIYGAMTKKEFLNEWFIIDWIKHQIFIFSNIAKLAAS